MNQQVLFGKDKTMFINLKEAANWASEYLNRNVTVPNISYLLLNEKTDVPLNNTTF